MKNMLEECKSSKFISSFKRKIININIYFDSVKSFKRLYLIRQVFVSILKLILLLNYVRANHKFFIIILLNKILSF